MGTKTFLSYANDLLVPFGETQISSSDWSSLTGPQLAAKNGVLRAVRQIMSIERKWPFNIQDGEQVLTAGTFEYAWPSGFRDVDMNSFYIEKDDTLNVNTSVLPEMSEEDWIRFEKESDFNNTTSGRNVPTNVVRLPSKYLITPNPNGAYTVKFKYYSIPTDMSAYTDTTTIPDEYQDVVIDHGMIWLNKFYENDEQQAQAINEAKESLKDMRSILINHDFVMRDTRVRNTNRGN